jgi:hypothetical protein
MLHAVYSKRSQGTAPGSAQPTASVAVRSQASRIGDSCPAPFAGPRSDATRARSHDVGPDDALCRKGVASVRVSAPKVAPEGKGCLAWGTRPEPRNPRILGALHRAKNEGGSSS